MICSVLIPSRGRPDGLHRAIRSVFATCTTQEVEVLVRFDDDDEVSLSRISEFEQYPRTSVHVGPRMLGYGSLHTMYEELSVLASGAWVFVMNDDAWVEGVGWDERIAERPADGVILQPETIANYQPENLKAAPCKYLRAEGGPFPIVPNRCWHALGWSELKDPVDTKLDELLRGGHGWRTEFVRGLTLCHARTEGEQQVVMPKTVGQGHPWVPYEHPGTLLPKLLNQHGPFDRMLDVGGGSGVVGRGVWRTGEIHVLDLFPPETEPQHFRLGTGLDAEQIYGPKSFDLVQCTETIEHLTKQDALRLIDVLESVAKKLVVISTPNGFMENHPETDSSAQVVNNPHQKHLCGFFAYEFEELGYSILMNGGAFPHAGCQLLAWKRL